MGKRIIILSLAMMLFAVAQGQQVESKKCKTCGKPFKECPNKGMHPQTQPMSSSARTQLFTVNGVSFKMVEVLGEHTGTFYIGETEVTQSLWKAVMGSNPSRFKEDNLPVETVSWEDCKTFIKKLNSLTCQHFRLPMEYEWKYAYKGGRKRCGYKYSGSDNIGSVAWYNGNSGLKPHPVAQKQANELGIYDMSGNVSEWCEDKGSLRGTTDDSRSARIIKGGNYFTVAYCCLKSYQGENKSRAQTEKYDHVGFRLALSVH